MGINFDENSQKNFTINYKDEVNLLDQLYHQRIFKKQTLLKAQNLINAFYKEFHSVSFSSLSTEELKTLWVCSETLDFLNRFDIYLGKDEYKEGTIYKWLKSKSKTLFENSNLLSAANSDLESKKKKLYQMRVVASTYLNELYRTEVPEDFSQKLEKIINDVEAYLKPTTLKREKELTYAVCYHDVMTYFYFLSGKYHRATGSFQSAITALSTAESHLLFLAENKSKLLKIQKKEGEYFQSEINRTGIVSLAKSSVYLRWGRIKQAKIYADRAIGLIAENDTYSQIQANSILGMAKRKSVSKDREKELKEATRLLRKSYNKVGSQTKKELFVPRLVIRIFYELQIAFILSGKLGDAVNYINRLLNLKNRHQNRSQRNEIKKIFRSPSWQSQIRVICSRIARKDDKNTYIGELIEAGRRIEREEGEGRTYLQKELDKEIESASLSIIFAKSAVHIAKASKIKLNYVDTLIVLGEAYIENKVYDEANRTFKDCLMIIKGDQNPFEEKITGRPKEETILTPENVNFHQPSIDGSDFSTLCHIRLAQIAIRKGEIESAEEEMKSFGPLPVEHGWIKALAEEVRREIEVVKYKSIIKINSFHSGQQLTFPDMEQEFYRKVFDLHMRGKRIDDVVREFKISKRIYRKLRAASLNGVRID